MTNLIQETVDFLEYVLKTYDSPVIKKIELPDNEDEYNYLRIHFMDGEIRTILVF